MSGAICFSSAWAGTPKLPLVPLQQQSLSEAGTVVIRTYPPVIACLRFTLNAELRESLTVELGDICRRDRFASAWFHKLYEVSWQGPKSFVKRTWYTSYAPEQPMPPWSPLRSRTRAKVNSLLSASPMELKVCGKWPVRRDHTVKIYHIPKHRKTWGRSLVKST